MKAKVGIVMATYQMKLSMIRQAVLSVLSQDMPEWRLIIVGVEGDELFDPVVREVKPDARVEAIREPEPNVYQQRNVGMLKAIEEMDCSYVTFLDSDDYMLPYKLHLELKIAELNGLDIVYSAYYYADPNLVIYKYCPVADRVTKTDMLESCLLPDYSLVESRFAREHLRIDRDDWQGYLDWPQFKTGCVYDYWLRALDHGARLGMHMAPTWLYRQRPGSLGKQLNRKELIDREMAINAAKRKWGIETPTHLEKHTIFEKGEEADYGP